MCMCGVLKLCDVDTGKATSHDLPHSNSYLFILSTNQEVGSTDAELGLIVTHSTSPSLHLLCRSRHSP